jgi:hypothetical protein
LFHGGSKGNRILYSISLAESWKRKGNIFGLENRKSFQITLNEICLLFHVLFIAELFSQKEYIKTRTERRTEENKAREDKHHYIQSERWHIGRQKIETNNFDS